MSLEIKKYPNGYAVCVSLAEDIPYDSLMDFDEFLGNSFTFLPRAVQQYRTGYFESNNDFAQYIYQSFDEYEDGIGAFLLKKWEQAKHKISGTHTFNEDGLTYWDDNAKKSYQEQWKPVLEAHLEYLKDCDDYDFEEFVENLDSGVTIYKFPFIAHLTLEDEYDVDQQRKKWVEHLTQKLAEFETSMDLTTLDGVVEYFTYGDSYVENWDKFSMIPDPDYWHRYEETIKQYLFGNPFITPVEIIDGYDVSLHLVSESESLQNIDGFMFVDSNQLKNDPVDAKANHRSYANKFLSHEFYDADLVFIVPEGKKHLYPDAEYSKDLGAYVVRDIESCLVLEESEALKYFDYIAEQPPFDPVYNYSVLGQVQKI